MPRSFERLKSRIRSSRYWPQCRRLLAYGIAVALPILLILMARLGLSFPSTRIWPSALFLFVVLSSWYGGLGPGVLSALAVVASEELLSDVTRLGDQGDISLLILLAMVAVVLSSVRMQRAERKQVLGLLSEGDATKVLRHLDRILQSREPAHFEEYLDSRQAWFGFHCYPTDDRAVLKFGDITEIKQQEALRPLPVWQDDRQFRNIFAKIEFTLVDQARCYILHQFAKQAAGLPGDLAEVGVYKGGTAKLLALTISPRAKKELHLFDTFTGMPAADAAADCHHEGDLGDTSLEAVQRSLRDCSNVHFYKGFFPATAGPIENLRFCMVHIDADIYKSVKDSCAFFYPRMEKGGIMVFDDYGFPSCPGARKAVDEFFADKPEFPVY